LKLELILGWWLGHFIDNHAGIDEKRDNNQAGDLATGHPIAKQISLLRFSIYGFWRQQI
jgi:hypothetical protein